MTSAAGFESVVILDSGKTKNLLMQVLIIV